MVGFCKVVNFYLRRSASKRGDLFVYIFIIDLYFEHALFSNLYIIVGELSFELLSLRSANM